MNFTTQAAEDILSKIERDPVEVRHWRQLLILCFDQKSIETLQTLQVILAAIEQIWVVKGQKAHACMSLRSSTFAGSNGAIALSPSARIWAFASARRVRGLAARFHGNSSSSQLVAK